MCCSYAKGCLPLSAGLVALQAPKRIHRVAPANFTCPGVSCVTRLTTGEGRLCVTGFLLLKQVPQFPLYTLSSRPSVQTAG